VEYGTDGESNHGCMVLSLAKAAAGDAQRWLNADVVVAGGEGYWQDKRLCVGWVTIRTRKEYGRRMAGRVCRIDRTCLSSSAESRATAVK
jgi:hypothetical protein